MNTGSGDLHSESKKEIEDVKLLVESMKYQKDDPSQQQQALRALGEILSQNKRAQDYFCSSSGVEYVLSLCKITESPAVCQSALYTLAMATEGNDFSQRTLTKKSVFQLLRLHLQAKNRPAATTSAFLLMTICDGNCEGQNLAKETKCLHSLCDLYKGCLPIYKLSSSCDDTSERWFNNIEENCLHLWSAVVVALHSLLQNPQNTQNQQLCCRLFPMIVNILQMATKQQNIVLPTTTLISAIVSGNAECQSKWRLLGGLRALINQLKEHVEHKEPAVQDISFLEHVVNTIGSAIAGHAVCLDSSADLGLVSLLIKCLDISQTPGVDDAVSKTFRTKCILALSICVDQCERNQRQLRDREGVERLVELLAQEQSEEFRRVAIFVLHCITGNSQGGPKPLHGKRTEKRQSSNVLTDSENDLSQVTSSTRDAQTQTDLEETQSICTTRQCSTDIREKQTTGKMTQKTSQDIRKANLRKKRFVSTKVLQPLIRSKTAWSKKISTEPTTKRINSNVDRPCAPTSQDTTECEACETILNSKNFIKTLKHCSSLCSYHRELDKLLQRKINDLRRRK
ncbi:telomere repeats-binding bouquet formation protein 1-like [Orbicella faveolata]|uniref:telomere repeats-binding bouquet formation protein 1-like n=1 Tax=Orbicella faveolata TaxID=48498 RepID=UPI0009E27BA1|nr:telomere repeats-binding bouquet formation protein 1-like [Orbicella faveolata]